jgi:hypothetical protein
MTIRRHGSAFPSARSVIDVPRSEVIAGIEWLGEEIPYPEPGVKGDSFALTWADDDNLYTSAGDPCWGITGDGLDFERIAGDAPHYEISKVNDMSDYRGAGGAGPKPTGLISIRGTLYLAVQNITGSGQWEDSIAVYGHGYDAHIVASTDYGQTWTPDIREISTPMFPGRSYASPAFVNYGQDNTGAVDSFVYAISGEGWDNGCHCRLARVPADSIMQRAAWEWVSGFDDEGTPQWSSEMTAAIPVISHPGYLGYVEMVYIAPLRRYLLLSWHHKVKSYADAGSELIIYDAPEPWGPFTLVTHEDPWESIEMNPYNPRLPLKWFDAGRLEGWLLFSGSWRNGGGTPFYRAHIRKFRLVLAGKE